MNHGPANAVAGRFPAIMQRGLPVMSSTMRGVVGTGGGGPETLRLAGNSIRARSALVSSLKPHEAPVQPEGSLPSRAARMAYSGGRYRRVAGDVRNPE